MSSGNLAAFPALPRLERLTILCDHDRPNPKTGTRAGHEATLAIIRQLTEGGLDPATDIRVMMSPIEGEDVADMVAKRRRAA